MNTNVKSPLSFLTLFTFLALFLLIPACVYAEEAAPQNSTYHPAGNTISSIGAIVENGDKNTAVGASVVIATGGGNEVSTIGAFAGMGDGNTAIGYDSQIISGYNNKAIGFGAQAGGGNDNTAIGRHASAIHGDSNTAMGAYSFAGGTGDSSKSTLNTAIGYGAQAATGNSVALGAYSVADRPNSVSVGSYGNERQITNLAPGVYDTDAVNMSQLRGVDDKVDRVGALALAFSALAPLPYDPKEPTQYSAGMGTYNGTNAVAIGIYHYTKPNVMINAAIGISSEGWEKSARFGVSWRTGGPKQKEVIPAVAPAPKKGIVERVKAILENRDKESA